MRNQQEMKTCVSCGEQIPQIAKKCSICSSYQTFRRYLDFGNTSIALAIGFLAILTTVPSTIQNLSEIFYFWKLDKVRARIVEINNDEIMLYVANDSRQEILLDNIVCMLFFPRHAFIAERRQLEGRANGEQMSHIWLTEEETINPIIMEFNRLPQILGNGESGVISFSYSHGFIAVEDKDGQEPVPSACFTDMSAEGDFSGAEIVEWIYPRYSDVDLPKLLSEIEIFDSANVDRTSLIASLIGYD